MRVIKKINNNVAVCQDGNGQELIALGKGIGFPKTPYELTDLSKIDMTFYRVSSQTIAMLKEISPEVISTSTEIVNLAQRKISNSLSPNIVFSLADHINFAIERVKKNQIFDFSLTYDIAHLYPKEYEMGEAAIKIIAQDLKVKLPDSEATAIAMHFINGIDNLPKRINSNSISLLDLVIAKIEEQFNTKIDRNSFAFNRFKVHFQYYLQRLENDKQIYNEITPSLITDLKKSNLKVYECGKEVVAEIDEQLNTHTTDDEMFYLMIYINRMLNKQK